MRTTEDIIKERIKKCKQALDDASFLLDNARYLAAVNRMYYAVFFIVTAYFAYKNIIVKSHKGVGIKVHSEMVKQEIITIEEGKIFDLLFLRRGEADYNDFVVYTENEIKELFAKTQLFIQKIESLIIINE